jgi:glycosyltransferase involved in cell wall biosynthesis
MERQLRGLGQASGDFTREAIRAMRAIEAMGHDPLILGFHPISRMNPFHGLLYRETWRSGIGAIQVIREETIPELTELSRLGFPTMLHLHWLNQVLGRAASAKEADGERRAFLDRLDRYRDAGGHLAWTVHNILPHGARFEDQEARLSQDVLDRCDVVHVMAATTAEIVAPHFTIPADRTIQVPHPSYLGAYEDFVSRDRARHELGLWPDEIVYVVLGAIRPYKGLRELLDGWPEVRAGDLRRRLVIAGGPSEEPGVAELLEEAAMQPGVLLFPGQVAPADVQLFLRAADIAVLPYVRALNSGALMLAITFGLPVVVPAGGGLAEVADSAFARTFEVDDRGSLVAAVRDVDPLLTPGARAAALEVAMRLAPGPLSERFGRGVRDVLAKGFVPPG